ncbi:MAG: dual specificity protein phosphatase family protein [Anaerolineae bacterium]|nr:dual specificity protein phosphatase family protein [Anaerolineae bacterium]
MRIHIFNRFYLVSDKHQADISFESSEISLPEFERLVALLSEREGQKTLIHDSPVGKFALIGYLVRQVKMTFTNAYNLISHRLGIWIPEKTLFLAVLDAFPEVDYGEQESISQFFVRQISSLRSGSQCVHPGIYLGGVSAVRSRDIQAVLRVDDDGEHQQPNPTMPYLYLPVEDGVFIEKSTLMQGTAFIYRFRQHNIFVHCQAGVSRSVTFILAYLIEYEKMSLADAYARIVSARAIAYPHPELLSSLIQHYGLPYSLEDIESDDFLENLLAEIIYKNE